MTPGKDDPGGAPGESDSASGAGVPQRLDVQQLLGPAQEVILIHNGEDYRLRVTSKGRLILTK